MSNKKAMELSINFIVMLIIAMTLFTFGIWFTYKFFGGAEQMRTDLDAQTQTQIENLLMSGNDRVVIPFNSKTLDKSNSAIFGVGILNVIGEQHTFTMSITKDDNYCPGDLKIIPSEDQLITLANNQNIVKSFAIQVVTMSNGKCIYSVTLKILNSTGGEYSPSQKVYIKPIGATSACTKPTSNINACPTLQE